MIENVWAGFISAIQMLLISAGIFVAWGGGFMLRERSHDLQRTYRKAVLALVGIVIVLTLLTGMGNMVKAFVYWAIVIGVPLALGLGPTEQAWQWLSQSERAASVRGGGFGDAFGTRSGASFGDSRGSGKATGSGFGEGSSTGGASGSVGVTGTGEGNGSARTPER